LVLEDSAEVLGSSYKGKRCTLEICVHRSQWKQRSLPQIEWGAIITSTKVLKERAIFHTQLLSMHLLYQIYSELHNYRMSKC
jgi:dTDP-4-amino-4,6-dideoxygalactose transaminase